MSTRPPIDMGALFHSTVRRFIVEVLPDGSPHDYSGHCWCDYQGAKGVEAMRWMPDDPAPRFTPAGVR